MEQQLVRNKSGVLEVQFDSPAWSDGDDLIRYLKQMFQAKVTEKFEGPDARVWTLKIESKVIVVNQWDTGDISLFAKETDDESLTRKIAATLGAV